MAIRVKTPDQLRRIKAARFLNQPLPDAPGEALKPPPSPVLPTWAEYALRRGEDVPGRVIPMYARWYQTCPICGKTCFLIHPFLMPALEEITEGLTDFLELGALSTVDPENLIRPHPCRFWDRDVPWDFAEPQTMNLKDYL